MVDFGGQIDGAGLLEAGDAVDTGGTSGGLAVYWDRAVVVPGAWVGLVADRRPLDRGWGDERDGKALDWLATSVSGGSATPESLVAEAAESRRVPMVCVFLPDPAGSSRRSGTPGRAARSSA